MIVFTLKCRHDHRFEAWFRNSETFQAQADGGEIACPICGDTEIGKAPMAPALAKSTKEPSDSGQVAAELRAVLTTLRRHVEATGDHVGDRFAEEARRIHYGETKARPIYGEASEAEAKDLTEEGIPVARIPWAPPEN